MIQFKVTDAVGTTTNGQVQVQANPPTPAFSSISNSASFTSGAISNGEIVTIFGTNLGPATGVVTTLDSNGAVPTSLAGVSVTFDGIAAPLLYVSATQINAVVPFFVQGPTSKVVVSYNGQPSTMLVVPVKGFTPGIFTLGGTNQGAVLNQDYTVNGPNNPAAKGSVIQIFATGVGLPTPALKDGQVPTGPSTTNFPGVAVLIGGQPAALQYAGVAPGLVAGADQINAVVPTNIQSGPVSLSFSVGGDTNASQPNVIVYVQVVLRAKTKGQHPRKRALAFFYCKAD